jgi:hypothetical protein
MTTPLRNAALAASMLCLLAACAAPAPDAETVATDRDALRSQNGIALNGIALNGIALNGIALNGIALNGIALNGMLTSGLAPGEGTNGLGQNGLVESSFATTEFQTWFAIDTSFSDMVMTYVARCALPAGVTLSYTTESSAHSWTGNLGLAPTWASGQPIPTVEAELVSACLAAHANRYGEHVQISVRGVAASGDLIATTQDEEASFTWREGCFFGNLFDGTGTWSGVDEGSLDPVTTTPRGCVAAFGQAAPCNPMAGAGRCSDVCAKDPTGAVYAECRGNLVDGTVRAFHPVQVLLKQSTVFRCGDGTCQFTESADTCAADCDVAP